MARVVAQEKALDASLALLREGEVVAIPTETVYGLAADATQSAAVARIYEAKKRPRFNPLIAHVGNLEMARALAVFPDIARKLAEAFWPGPLTLVLPLREGAGISPLVTAGLPTIALRHPQGFGARLISAFGKPLAAPSANSSGRVTGTSAQAVDADLGKRIPLIVDGGQTAVGLESTIVKVEQDKIVLLRPGGLSAEAIESIAGTRLERRVKEAARPGIEAPGMMTSHYAPRAAVRMNATGLRRGEALLAFGPDRIDGAEAASAIRNLSPAGDLREAAANLFAHLLALDNENVGTIAAEPVPASGLGEAINDRLARAAAPRDEQR